MQKNVWSDIVSTKRLKNSTKYPLHENDWCKHIFRESNKAADTHANWLMDNGDSGPGAQLMTPDFHDKMQKSRNIVLSIDEARWGWWTWCGCLDSVVTV